MEFFPEIKTVWQTNFIYSLKTDCVSLQGIADDDGVDANESRVGCAARAAVRQLYEGIGENTKTGRVRCMTAVFYHTPKLYMSDKYIHFLYNDQ